MSKKLGLISLVLAISLVAAVPAFAGGRATSTGVIFVESQGLYFDTLGAADPLPNIGPFQKLVPGDPYSVTQYGPGDPGFYGGRWWVDVNGNNLRDEGDHFFLCPLLGPGRETP